MFDEAIREDQCQNEQRSKPLTNSPKIKKIKQLSKNLIYCN